MPSWPKLVLGCSLAGNALFATWLCVARFTSAPGSVTPSAPDVSSALTARGASEPPLASLDAAALHARLQKTDLPREVIDALVLRRLYAKHDARRRELVRDAMQRPWWETARSRTPTELLTPAQRQELRSLEAQARAEALRLLGPAALDSDGTIAFRHRYLPPERAAMLDTLLHDYADMLATQRDETGGIRTTADRTREKLLEEERQRDIAALLTPEERELYELRQPVGMNFAPRAFEPTEAEYRTLHALHRRFQEENPAPVALTGLAATNAFDYPEFKEQVRAALGEPRYTDWLLAHQQFASQLSWLAPEAGLSNADVRELAGMLETTTVRSRQIYDDSALTIAQKRTALEALAIRARTTLRERLGAAAAADGVARTFSWLDTIERGNAVTIEGARTSWRSIETPSRPRPPTPPTK